MSRVLAAALSVLILFTAACSGDDEPGDTTPTGTPPRAENTAAPLANATATPTGQRPINCTLANNVCSTAATAVVALLKVKNLDVFVQNARAQEFTCPGPNQTGVGGPYPLCQGAAPGTKRSGYQEARFLSEGFVVDASGLKADLQTWLDLPVAGAPDAYGSPAAALYTVACPAQITACGDRFALVFSKLVAGPTPQRNQFVIYVEQGSFVLFISGILLQPEIDAALKGGSVDSFLAPQGWPPLRTFYLMPPS